jgi:NitT/TauT family transport system substrate-binding protein
MRQPLRILPALASILTLFACSVAGAVAQEAAKKPLRKVSVGILYISADAGIMIAKEKGYFDEMGLDVEIVRFKGGADQIPLISTSRLDVGNGAATPGLFNAYRRGIDVPIVSGKTYISPNNTTGDMMLMRNDHWEAGKRTARDLKGLKIAVSSIQSTMINHVMRNVLRGGLKREDVEIVEMPFPQYIPALKNKAVDAVWPLSPFLEAIADREKLAVRMPDTALSIVSPGQTSTLMFYSPEFMKSDAAVPFLVAHLKGQRDYHRAIHEGTGDRAEVCGIIKKYLPFIPANCGRVSMSAVLVNGEVNIDSLEAFQRDWLAWGIMTEPADIRAKVNTSILNQAIARLGQYEPRKK